LLEKFSLILKAEQDIGARTLTWEIGQAKAFLILEVLPAINGVTEAQLDPRFRQPTAPLREVEKYGFWGIVRARLTNTRLQDGGVPRPHLRVIRNPRSRFMRAYQSHSNWYAGSTSPPHHSVISPTLLDAGCS
jgi:hypothetical protein